LVASFRATLEEVREADVLVHVIDASHPTWEEQRVVVDEVLHDLGVHDRPVLHAFNKMDLLSPEDALALTERMNNLLPGSLFVSAQAADGLAPLKAALLTGALQSRPMVALRIAPSDGKTLAEAYRHGDILTRRDEEDGAVVLTLRADAATLGRLTAHGAEPVPLETVQP
jgi:GTP-binding protein HflX